MRYFIDGNHICITKDDFVDLQKSPAVFFPRESEIGKAIESGGILNMAVGDLRAVRELLDSSSIKEDIEAEEKLMIVRLDPDLDAWIIDEDSRHHLEYATHTVFELQLSGLRPLVRDVGVAATLSSEN